MHSAYMENIFAAPLLLDMEDRTDTASGASFPLYGETMGSESWIIAGYDVGRGYANACVLQSKGTGQPE